MKADPARWAARLMAMDETAWKRHQNPWSVWTRVLILPLFALAVFSRVWLGVWCLVPVLLVVGWTLLNPRLFPPPRRTDSWAARGVRGDLLWLSRRTRPVPRHHAGPVRALLVASFVGLAVLGWGLWALDPWACVAGVVLAGGAKLWFVDRMVWLCHETGDERFTPHP